MRKLTKSQIIAIHEELIAETGVYVYGRESKHRI